MATPEGPPIEVPDVVRVTASVDELLAGATERQPLLDGAGKSGALLERVMIGGEPHVVKYLDLTQDWTMRAAGMLGGATLTMWRRGLLHRLPTCLNQPIVAVAAIPKTPSSGGGCAILMHDVARSLVPVSDEPLPLPQHLDFLRHMASLHAAFWEGGPEIDLMPPMHRYLDLSPWLAEAEAGIGSQHRVPKLVAQGWPLLADVAPRAAAVVTPLALDPGPLVAALARTPQTLVHGNWKLDNLGTDDAGRTIVLDWELPGRDAPLGDLAWYLAINCRRLPQSKEAAIDAYRAALVAEGIDTEPWWDAQLRLCLLGALVQFGWEKAFSGYDHELAWWEARALDAVPLLSP